VRRRLRIPTVLFTSSLAIGIVLRVIQYVSATSLWLDELALVNALAIHKIFDPAFEPIGFTQIAPVGYASIEKLILLALPASELTLRFPAFVLGCAAIPLSWVVATRTPVREYAWAISLGVALSPALIFQSAQVKPYSGDVAITLLLSWLALRDFDAGACRPSRALTAACLLAPWFSFPSHFVVAAIALAWIVLAGTRERVDRRRTALAICCWGAATLAAQVAARQQMDPPTARFMHGFWASGFAPLAAGPRAVAVWLTDTLANILRSLTGDRGGRPLVALAVVGLWGISRQSQAKAITLGMPIAFAVCAATFKQYPLTDRASLWAAPILPSLRFPGLSSARACSWELDAGRRRSLLAR